MANVRNPNRTCPECGADFIAAFGLQTFCTPAHTQAFYDRQAKRAKNHLALIQVWRSGKHGKSDMTSYALTELCRLVDDWNAEDRAAGRRPDVLVRAKMDGGWRAGDGRGWRAG